MTLQQPATRRRATPRTDLSAEEVQARDSYYFGIIRDLDREITRVSGMIERSQSRIRTSPIYTTETRRQLLGRLNDLISARQDLVDLVFRVGD